LKLNLTYRSGCLLRELGWVNPIGLQALQLTNEVPGESLQQKMHFSRELKKKFIYVLTIIHLKKYLCGQKVLIQLFFASEYNED
jgi:hypothetical protein